MCSEGINHTSQDFMQSYRDIPIEIPGIILSVYNIFFLFARLNLPNTLISIGKKKKFDSQFPSPCWCTKSVKFHFRWVAKPRDQKQETGNDCDVI